MLLIVDDNKIRVDAVQDLMNLKLQNILALDFSIRSSAWLRTGEWSQF